MNIYIVLYKNYKQTPYQYWLKAFVLNSKELHQKIMEWIEETDFDMHIDFNIYKMDKEGIREIRLNKIAYIHLGKLYTF